MLTERTGKKRGKYVPRKRVDDNVKVASSFVDGDDGIEYNGEMMFKLPNGSFLPEKYRDVYEWFAGRIPPKPWREALAKMGQDKMTQSQIAKECVFPWA